MQTEDVKSGEAAVDQLDREKKAVSYDVYDMTVRQLVDMVAGQEIDVAPEYQRHFIWDEQRESELVESIYLGIPVPSLYMAANRDGTWEVVDGVQRLSTLVHFCGEKSQIHKVGRSDRLALKGLTKLTALNGKTFETLPKALQLNFSLRPVRVTTLNDKSDYSVRYDLFERLNTGGVRLHPQEIRNCVFRGPFRDSLRDLARNSSFLKMVKLSDKEQKSAVEEECVLRFFAFYEGYKDFDHSVVEFLNDYMIAQSSTPISGTRLKRFIGAMEWLSQELPNGIVRGSRQVTPINLFEAVAVGTALALPNAKRGVLNSLINSQALRKFTTAGTNSKRMVVGRIEYVRDGLKA